MTTEETDNSFFNIRGALEIQTSEEPEDSERIPSIEQNDNLTSYIVEEKIQTTTEKKPVKSEAINPDKVVEIANENGIHPPSSPCPSQSKPDDKNGPIFGTAAKRKFFRRRDRPFVKRAKAVYVSEKDCEIEEGVASTVSRLLEGTVKLVDLTEADDGMIDVVLETDFEDEVQSNPTEAEQIDWSKFLQIQESFTELTLDEVTTIIAKVEEQLLRSPSTSPSRDFTSFDTDLIFEKLIATKDDSRSVKSVSMESRQFPKSRKIKDYGRKSRPRKFPRIEKARSEADLFSWKDAVTDPNECDFDVRSNPPIDNSDFDFPDSGSDVSSVNLADELTPSSGISSIQSLLESALLRIEKNRKAEEENIKLSTIVDHQVVDNSPVYRDRKEIGGSRRKHRKPSEFDTFVRFSKLLKQVTYEVVPASSCDGLKYRKNAVIALFETCQTFIEGVVDDAYLRFYRGAN